MPERLDRASQSERFKFRRGDRAVQSRHIKPLYRLIDDSHENRARNALGAAYPFGVRRFDVVVGERRKRRRAPCRDHRTRLCRNACLRKRLCRFRHRLERGVRRCGKFPQTLRVKLQSRHLTRQTRLALGGGNALHGRFHALCRFSHLIQRQRTFKRLHAL